MSEPDAAARRRRSERPTQLITRAATAALLTTAAVAATAVGGAVVTPASAAAGTITAAFSGGSGTFASQGVLYAKSGAALTLTVTAPSDTQCISGVPAGFAGPTTSSTAKSNWTFTGTGAAGDGTRTFTVAASPGFNKNNACTGASVTATPSYVSDNTGPVVTAALVPAANANGWNNTNATVTWSAADVGSGVADGPKPASFSATSNGITTQTSTATDRLGNSGTGSVDVRIDKSAPSITGIQVANPDGSVTVTFTCSDSNSGQQVASGIATCLADGSTTNSVTVTKGGAVTGTATDKAGNTGTASVTVQNIDTTPPVVTGAATTQPNVAGWYHGDVTFHWTASDPESGVPTAPADTTITGEGSGLTAAVTVVNGAGLSTTATSKPVNIDRTAPTTGIAGGSNAWTNGDVTLTLAPSDNLSGVSSTQYAVDGGAMQAGTSITLSTEGEHTVTYRSTDAAGNLEPLQTAVVRIDKTAPTIGHSFAPASYSDGAWTNQDVTVTFVCADQGGSGVADCTAPVTKSAEGEYAVTGTARDNAGNAATDTASVRIDKTKPTLSAEVRGAKNAAGWYHDDVTVAYTASDDRSGVAGSPAADVLGEGADQSASASVTDAAGNTATTTVTGIDVDKTAPVLTADYPTGWQTGDVTVRWTCVDALSGVANKPADTVVTGEGEDLSSTASCTDVAGNTTLKTVTAIKIDRTAPVTTADVAAPNAAGWYDHAVDVTLTGSDNLRGAVSTYYQIDGGATKSYAGPFSVGEGDHTVSYWSQDAAGNVETPGDPLVLHVDTTAPTTTVVNPISPDSGWFVTSGIPVAFTAEDAGSGIAATYFRIDDDPVQTYGDPVTADLSTGQHTITFWSVDLAGNVENHATTNTIAVDVDTDAPTITGTASPAANANGWNNTDVNVSFSCADVGSGLQTGVAGCAGDTVLGNEGAGQSATGDAVDVAGNTRSAKVSGINIDKTPPTLMGVPADPNGAGWYNGDVKVEWQGDDALSGIDPASQPQPTLVTGEGKGLTAGPVTITDKAGNTSAPATVTGINIDRTAPALTAAPTTQPNASGWYRDEVTVDYRCTDALSGVAYCPTSKVVKGDGAAQSVTSDQARDLAGNLSAATTVRGINIDGTAPTTSANNTCTAQNGYCTGSAADVVLTATDQAGLSGVKEVHYSVDGGAEQVVQGSTTTVSVPLSGSGAGTVKYWAVDNAGNVEAKNSIGLKWDNIAPTVTHILSPAANADGWNNSDVTITFSAKDDDSGSGVASVTGPVTVSGETAGQVVTGTAKDTAGNVGTDSVTVQLDRTRPTITGKVTSGMLGNNGWYTGPVTVTFTCSDALSGVASCPDPVVLSANGSNTATGTVTDRAGNTATVAVAGINIDQEKPTLTTSGVNVQGQTYTLGAVAAPSCTATDSFSGVASCAVKVSGGDSNGVGTFTYTATATDRAGNTTTITGSYQVVYAFGGFLQPINDTAHEVGASTSIFKAGSTVPAKFQVTRNDGTVVSTAVAEWLTPVKGSSTSAAVDESAYATSPDSGTTYRYDTSGQQYVYNWKSGTGGSYWRIGVKLDDGRTYFVNIGLR